MMDLEKELTEEEMEELEKLFDEMMETILSEKDVENGLEILTKEQRECAFEEFKDYFSEVTEMFGTIMMINKPSKATIYFVEVCQKAINYTTDLVVSKKVTPEVGYYMAFSALNFFLENFSTTPFINFSPLSSLMAEFEKDCGLELD